MENSNLIDNNSENILPDPDSSEEELFPSITNIDGLIQKPNQETLLAQSRIAQEAIAAATRDQFRILLVENALNNIVILTALSEYATRKVPDSVPRCQQIIDAYIESACDQIKEWGHQMAER